MLTTFFVSVAAGVVTHIICKWLDRHQKQTAQQLALLCKTRNPQPLAVTGDFLLTQMLTTSVDFLILRFTLSQRKNFFNYLKYFSANLSRSDVKNFFSPSTFKTNFANFSCNSFMLGLLKNFLQNFLVSPDPNLTGKGV